jgi:hypothetical protein
MGFPISAVITPAYSDECFLSTEAAFFIRVLLSRKEVFFHFSNAITDSEIIRSASRDGISSVSLISFPVYGLMLFKLIIN